MAILNLEPLHKEFGARVMGIDLSQPLLPEVVAEIQAVIDKYSLVCFPGQKMDDAKQLEFTRTLGDPEESHVSLGQTGQITYFGTIGNVEADGSQIGNKHKKTIFLTGNNLWHTDSSFRPVPSRFSIMCAYEVPEVGGATEFVSARVAYRQLEDAKKQQIEPLVAIHDYVFSRSKVAPDAVSPSLAASLPPVRQKLVRINPQNGEKNFYVGAHAKAIEGWEGDKSRELIEELEKCATKPENVYTHDWQPTEVVIWDNRCLLHRGSGYDADRYRRYMRQTRVRGDCPTLQE